MKRGLSVGDLSTINSADFDDDDGGGSFTQVKTRSKKTRRTVNTGQSNNVIGTVGSQPGSCSVNSSVVDHQSPTLNQLQKSVSELNAVVFAQKLIIDRLSTQLNFVLSYLDISNAQIVPEGRSSTVLSGTPGTVSIVSTAQCEQSLTEAIGTSSAHVNSTVPTYASVSKNASVSGANPVVNRNQTNVSFQQAVATVVYTNQRDKERRARSLIVNGLSPSDGITDADSFRHLCTSEFSISPQISSTRRLGRSADGRIKPLLVNLTSKEEVDEICKHAKSLRRSAVSAVRDNVFINRNLTKIEAQLAYNERCQRRQRQHQQHQRQLQQVSDTSLHPVSTQHINSNAQQQSTGGSSLLVSSGAISMPPPISLRPDVPPFTSFVGSSVPNSPQ